MAKKEYRVRLYGGEGVKLCPHIFLVSADEQGSDSDCEYIETATLRCRACRRLIVLEIKVN